MFCGTFYYQKPSLLIDSLPDYLHLSLQNTPVQPLVSLFLQEAEKPEQGTKSVIDALSNVLFIYILRHAQQIGLLNQGLLAALQDKRLNQVLEKILFSPQLDWNIEQLAEFETALDKAYKKNKSKISLPGFRKGKAPRAMIEKMYGAGVFYEDAANDLIPGAYESAAKESELEIVAQPSIDVTQIEKGKSFIFTATVAVKPEVTLGDYKGIEVEKKTAEVTDEELQAEIDKVRESNSRMITIEDRAVEDGDITTIDFEGFVDGEPFEGGKGEDYPLTIGSHSFIDNFEEQLIGKKIGEETEVNVTFPEQYQAKELQGKPAVFKVTVKEIKVKELPEVDDDFAQDVSEFDTVDEYKEDLKKKLLENKEAALREKRKRTS